MFEPKRILVPTDFSPLAWAALEDASAIADTYAAWLDVIHVWDLQSVDATEDMAISQPPLSRVNAGGAQAHSMMEQLVCEARAKDLSIRNARVIAGEAVPIIVNTVKQGNYDLVVIGTHGRQGFARMILGSVAERVVRLAPCAVLVARGENREAL